MIADENDEKLTQGNKIIYFVYFTIYGMIFVALAPNYHSTLVWWKLFVIVVTNIQLTCNTNVLLVLIVFKTYGYKSYFSKKSEIYLPSW